MLSKESRIKNKAVLTKLLKSGQIIKGKLGALRFEEKAEAPSQFAVIVSKKIDPKAVGRNKLKRRITEAIRQNLNSLNKNISGIFIAYQRINKSDYNEIEKQIIEFFQKI